ncbi:MAG: RNA helicase CrhR [Phycisphaerae bacterium]|nr:RNA helicase CrhR [Phycisphaerae bacterium]
MKPQTQIPAAFAELGITTDLLKGLHKAGFETPTDIQRALIPLVLQGRDVLGQARTGTGKTAAFGLPILQLLEEQVPVQALVLVPTRELAAQVAAELRRFAEFTPLNITPLYGGQSIKAQVKLLEKRTQLVVATPGRALDLIDRKIITLERVQYAVLDEVDRMLDIGFIDDIRKLLGRITHAHQTIFVSATLSPEVKKLATQFMRDPVEANVSQDELTVERIDQLYCTVEPWDKFHLLKIILATEQPRLAIVFTNTKHQARKLAKKLFEAGVNVKEIHGDLVQRKREKVMERFRRHQIQVLVATDLAARGIDVHNISHIINYDLPEDKEIYVHRIGRTARMGAFGKAISFVTREQGELLTQIEKLIDKEIPAVKFEGFTPSAPPRRDEPVMSATPSVSRMDTPLFGAAAEGNPSAPPRTLGSKFRPARRRR